MEGWPVYPSFLLSFHNIRNLISTELLVTMKVFTTIVREIVSPKKNQYELHELGPQQFYVDLHGGNGGQQIRITRLDHYAINPQGTKLFYTVYLNPAASSNTFLMLLHSSAGSQMEMLTCIRELLSARFNVCAMDFAGCGRSQGTGVSFGIREANDMETVVNTLKQHYGLRDLVLWGREMGANAAVIYSQRSSNKIQALVLEDPIFNLKEVLKYNISKKSGMPSHLLDPAVAVLEPKLKQEIGVDLDELNLQRYIANFTQIPALFAFSENQENLFIPIQQNQKFYNLYPCQKKTKIIKKHPENLVKNILVFYLQFFIENLPSPLLKEYTKKQLFQISQEIQESFEGFQEPAKAKKPGKEKSEKKSLEIFKQSPKKKEIAQKGFLRTSLNSNTSKSKQKFQLVLPMKEIQKLERQHQRKSMPNFLKSKFKIDEKQKMRISLSSAQETIRRVISARIIEIEEENVRNTIDPAGLKSLQSKKFTKSTNCDSNAGSNKLSFEGKKGEWKQNSLFWNKIQNPSSPQHTHQMNKKYSIKPMVNGSIFQRGQVGNYVRNKQVVSPQSGPTDNKMKIFEGNVLKQDKQKISISHHILRKQEREKQKLKGFKFQRNLLTSTGKRTEQLIEAQNRKENKHSNSNSNQNPPYLLQQNPPYLLPKYQHQHV